MIVLIREWLLQDGLSHDVVLFRDFFLLKCTIQYFRLLALWITSPVVQIHIITQAYALIHIVHKVPFCVEL